VSIYAIQFFISCEEVQNASLYPDNGIAMTLLLYDDRFLMHDFSGHPECAPRLSFIMEHLKKSPLWANLKMISPREASEEELALVHTPDHIREIKNYCENGGGWLDSDTYSLDASFSVACLAAGALLTAVEHIAKREARTAFCAVRPPGHHATRDKAMGFCLFNNIAVAARFIQKKKWGRKILIVDWDVHHGNGTQDIFWEDPDVAYFSLHRFPFYPGTGSAEEIGEGPGKGNIFNLPIHMQMSVEQTLHMAEVYLESAAKKIQPDWILISCGFDAYEKDPIGGLGFQAESYRRLTKIVKRLADQYAQGRIVSALEGGYALEALGPLAEAHIDELGAS
jgi:acetoin utilization deacetylase AcuC-like enzyme